MSGVNLKEGSQNKDYTAYAVSGLTGLLVTLVITQQTGKYEAWDSQYYYPVGIPVMCLVVAGLSYYAPAKSWRWTVTMALGQTVAMWLAGGSMNLWPLSILVMMVMSLPQFVTGFLVSRFLKREQ